MDSRAIGNPRYRPRRIAIAHCFDLTRRARLTIPQFIERAFSGLGSTQRFGDASRTLSELTAETAVVSGFKLSQAITVKLGKLSVPRSLFQESLFCSGLPPRSYRRAVRNTHILIPIGVFRRIPVTSLTTKLRICWRVREMIDAETR